MQGIPSTQVILDDAIGTGDSDEEHLCNLDMFLQKLQENGLKADAQKCKFFKEIVNFCCHVINKEGPHKSD